MKRKQFGITLIDLAIFLVFSALVVGSIVKGVEYLKSGS